MRTQQGTITSLSGNKTVVVTVNRYETHPKYSKRYRVSKKFHAHNENVNLAVGDTVTIRESRPLSRLKRWVVVTDETSSSNAQ